MSGGQSRPRSDLPERPWPGPRKQSAFVFLFLGEKLYATRHKTNMLGTPGGKRRDEDDSLSDTVERKFQNEIGKDMPKGEYRYLDWRQDKDHTVRFFCKTLTRREADDLPIGPLDTESKEVEALWLPWEAQLRLDKKKLRFHVTPGLRLYQKCLAGRPRFGGTHRF